MELAIRNCILYKLRNYDVRLKELDKLKKCYEERKQEIIDESPAYMDGLPHGKGTVSNPTQNKVIRIEQLDKRIKTMDREFDTFRKFEEKINAMGSLTRRIYFETMKRQSNLELKAMEYGMATRTLYNYRTKLFEMLAEDLGEYIDLDKL